MTGRFVFPCLGVAVCLAVLSTACSRAPLTTTGGDAGGPAPQATAGAGGAGGSTMTTGAGGSATATGGAGASGEPAVPTTETDASVVMPDAATSVDAGADAIIETTSDAPPEASVDATSTSDASDGGRADVVFHASDGPDPKPVYLGTYAPPTLENVTAMAAAPDGSLYFAGAFGQPTDFDPGPGVDLRTPHGPTDGNQGPSDAFVTKLDANGKYEWTITWGGASSHTGVSAIALGASTIAVAGFYTGEVDFDPSDGVATRVAGPDGSYSGFIARFTADGKLLWASTFIGTGGCVPKDLAIAADGAVYVGGSFDSVCDLDPGPAHDDHTSFFNTAFLVKLAGDDGRQLWSRLSSGDSCNASITGVALTPDDAPWMTGVVSDGCTFNGVTIPTLGGTTSGGLLASASPAGDSRGLWKIGDDVGGNAIEASPDGSIYVAGYALGTNDFDPGPGVATRVLNEDDHHPTGVLLHFGADATFQWIVTIDDAPLIDIAALAQGGVIAVGLPPPDLLPAPGMLLARYHDDARLGWSFRVADPDVTVDRLVVGPTTFAFSGSVFAPTDLDPGAGVDVVAAHATYLSRYSY